MTNLDSSEPRVAEVPAKAAGCCLGRYVRSAAITDSSKRTSAHSCLIQKLEWNDIGKKGSDGTRQQFYFLFVYLLTCCNA
jgi:hypothetical protein